VSKLPASRFAWAADVTATQLLEKLGGGNIRAGEVADVIIERTEAREPEIGAYSFFDPEMVRAQAKAADMRRMVGKPPGILNGVPVAIKDIVDTADMPTENGTTIDAGRRPKRDATIVSRLRAAGAVITGKTVTAELAFLHPGKTRNPHDLNRTPGGSSSGSAAAVAAGMVPLAIGTQTNGSVIRPASFCGVVGFKPSHGLIPRTGILSISRELDTVGVFGRSVEDVALLADALAGYDPVDPDTAPAAAPELHRIATSKPPVRPDLVIAETYVSPRAEPATRAGFEELTSALGEAAQSIKLAENFSDAHPYLRSLMLAGMARSLSHYYDHAKERLSPEMQAAIEEGRAVKAVDFIKARDWRVAFLNALDQVFDRFDAIITPAALGEAPLGLESTGDPSFCTLWTYCGLPTVTLPLLEGENGLPVGVQLVGRPGGDARLLRTARWLTEFLTKEPSAA
jgi:Asp-tRNA(Asn)/Glu-tRNA(Gln) amidotransferase A subunit family amidase